MRVRIKIVIGVLLCVSEMCCSVGSWLVADNENNT